MDTLSHRLLPLACVLAVALAACDTPLVEAETTADGAGIFAGAQKSAANPSFCGQAYTE